MNEVDDPTTEPAPEPAPEKPRRGARAGGRTTHGVWLAVSADGTPLSVHATELDAVREALLRFGGRVFVPWDGNVQDAIEDRRMVREQATR